MTHAKKWNDTRHCYIFLLSLYDFVLSSGISVGWWKYTHNVHHIRTNDVVFDPDIQHLPIFAITVKYLSNVYSKFHDRVMAYDKAAQWFVKHQHILFIPIVLLARLNLHLQSFIFVIWTTEKNPQQKLRLGKWHKVIEILTLIGYFCWVCPLIYNTNHPVVYFFISHITAGMLLLFVNVVVCTTILFFFCLVPSNF